MNNRDAIEYLKEKNQKAMNNKNMLLESYREAGQDAFENPDPLYLRKVNVTYPTTGDIDEDDIEAYRTELSELMGEFITSTVTVKELINDMDDEEVQDLLVNWETIYKKIFESLEGQVIDYKKLRLTINKRLNERMYLERQSKKLKGEMGQDPSEVANIDKLANKLPTEDEVKNNVVELDSEFYQFFYNLGLLGQNDKSMAKLAINLHRHSKNAVIMERVDRYLNELANFSRPERIDEIVFKYNVDVLGNNLVSEFKKFCNTNGIISPISSTGSQKDETMKRKLNTLSNNSLGKILQFIDHDVPAILNERSRSTKSRTKLVTPKPIPVLEPIVEEPEEEPEEELDWEDEEGPGEKGEPDEDVMEIMRDLGEKARKIVYEHFVGLLTNKGVTDKKEIDTKFKAHTTSDIYTSKLNKASEELSNGNTDKNKIFQSLDDVRQTRSKKVVVAKKPAKVGKGLKPHQKAIKDKYYIDIKKLNSGVLEIRYMSNKHLTGIKSQRISNTVKQIILSMSDGNLDEDLFKKATKAEQNLIRNIARLFKIDIDDDGDDDYDREFDILIGQYESGNDSELLRKKIKSYISHGMKIGRISRKHGYDLLLEISL